MYSFYATSKYKNPRSKGSSLKARFYHVPFELERRIGTSHAKPLEPSQKQERTRNLKFAFQKCQFLLCNLANVDFNFVLKAGY